MNFVPDKSKLKDVMGRFITHSLFIETNYNEELAVYSLTDEDKEYNGRIYPSLRKLYLEENDPTEYDFANKYLYNWDHWLKICENKVLGAEIDKWRVELEVKLRSEAVRAILKMDDKFQPMKWAADGHWNVRRGRPSKDELKREKKIRERVAEETKSDADRIAQFVRKPNA